MTTDELRAIAEACVAADANPPVPALWTCEEDEDGYWLVNARGDGIATALHTHITYGPLATTHRLIAAFGPARALAACRLADALEALGDYPQSREAIAEGRAALAAWRAL